MSTPLNFLSGSALRKARKRKKMNLREVSDLTSVSIATLSRLENGSEKVSIGVVRELSKIYNVIFMIGDVQ